MKTETVQFHVHGEALTDLVRTGIEWMGRTWTVVPLVMVREMVLSAGEGEPGHLLPFAEIERTANMAAWEGRPLTISHPEDGEGRWQSAGLLSQASRRVGEIHNVRADSKARALVAEGWIDEAWAAEVPRGQALLERAQGGEPLENSTGYYAHLERKSGLHGGKRYNGVHRGIFPDHHALLLDEVGKCSLADGCGANRLSVENSLRERIAAEGVGESVNDPEKDAPDEEAAKSLGQTIMQAIRGALSGHDEQPRRKPQIDTLFWDLQANQELSHEDIEARLREAIQEAEDAEDSFIPIFAVFEDRVVYQVGEDETLFQRTYEMSEDGDEVTLGEPTEVRRRVEFEEVGQSAGARNTRKGEGDMDREKAIELIVNCECLDFEAEELAEFSDARLAALAGFVQSEGEGEGEEGGQKPGADGTEGGDAAGEGESAAAGEEDLEERVSNAVTAALEKHPILSGLAAEIEGRRKSVVEEIVAHQNNRIPKETLEDWGLETLEAYRQSLEPRSFFGAGGVVGGTGPRPTYNSEENRETAKGVVRRKKRSELEAE